MNISNPIHADWQIICSIDDLVPGSGVAVWLNGCSAALFWLPDQEPGLYVLAHHDPLSGAEVLAHGLLCESGGVWSVASPLYKHHYRLTDGVCLEQPDITLQTWPVRLEDQQVQIFC